MASTVNEYNESQKTDVHNTLALVPDYSSPAKWYDIASMTLCNYSNMMTRLQWRQKYSDFILIYYSIFIIVNSLTVKFFPDHFNGALSSYLGLISSIVMLAFSLINSSARYSQRIDQLTASINDLKTLKRDIDITNEEGFKKNLGAFKDKYYKITDHTEVRNNMDFFLTLKQSCESKGYTWRAALKRENEECKQLAKYLLEINASKVSRKILLWTILDICLIFLPILAISICFLLPMQVL